MTKLATVMVAAYLAASLTAQQPSPPPEPTTIERAEKLLQQGRYDAAIETLRAEVAADRLAGEERELLARVLAWLGRTDEALALLHQGLGIGDGDDDASLQWEIGSLQQRLGDDGPFFQRRGEQVVYLPADKKVDEEAWRSEHYRQALASFRVVLARHPDSESAYQRVGELQGQLQLHEDALATWSEAENRFPASSAAPVGRARGLTALGRADEAAAACEKALKLAPRLAEVHAMLAELYEQTGKSDAALRARHQAQFYEWAPEFLELDFATAGDAFTRLAPRLGDEPSNEELARVRKRRSSEIERLIATRDAVSTQLLALLCYHHEDHGEAEDQWFAELEARGADAIAVLRSLLENAQTTCTQKGAAQALARLRAPGILETLIEMLPGDIRPLFDANIAGALAELGDQAAVAPLIEFANLSEEVGESEADGEFMAREGRESARLRAVLAVGVLGGDAARTALQKGVGHPSLGAGCRVALYRITRDETMVEPMRATVLDADSLHQDHLIEYVRGFAPEVAQKLEAKEDSDKKAEKK